QAASGLGAWVRDVQHWGFRFAITLGASLAVFVWIRGDAGLRQLNAAARALPLRTSLLLLHIVLVLPLMPLSHLLYGSHTVHFPFFVLVVLWSGFALAATVALCLAFAPWQLWRDASQALGVVWIYALAAAGLAACAMQWSQRLWAPTAAVTFDLVRWVLAPLLSTLRADPANLILYTDNFAIQVSELCSGLEGAGLMLAFCGAWLVYCRREFIFPRALLLIPAGLLLIFSINVLRIAALMLIGDAGLTDVAVYGFHSQAGWIAFNCAACGVAIVSRRSGWLQRPVPGGKAVSAENLTAAYLLPFLVVLGGRMIVLAVSGASGPWHVLPALAAALALWHYRRDFAGLAWRFSWRGVAVGLGVFVLWMFAARWLRPADAMRWGPDATSQPWSTLWVLTRILGSVVIIPVAEELAYRGYLLRRLVARDFAAVRFEGVGLWPLLVSAAVFGAAHGTMWPPAVLAGLAYGILVTRTGRIGEAVCAHVTTEGLIAAALLLGNHWALW
ncbi:MAG TPA: exosortase E/protease, VPEID-CTERM system, partial [Burkholderiales bacterium]|nr:exosortase E/protease, VPEID-CTERM system [Burkholderiales bacterium]